MFYIFTKQIAKFLNLKNKFFLKNSKEFSKFLCDFNINLNKFSLKPSLSKFLLNVTASNQNFCDLTGNFVNNLLKLIQQYLNNIIILKFKNFDIIFKILLQIFKQILKIHCKNLKILLKIVLNFNQT